MRHNRIIKSTRHKKLKTVNELSEFNYVNTQSIRDQGTPKKVTQIMEFKAKSKQASAQPNPTKRNVKLNKKYNTLAVKTGAQTTIEKGMTRAPKTMPETVEKGILESEYQFINRLNRMVAKSIAEANLEEHFDVDLGGKVNNNTAGKDDKMNFLTPEESKKLEKKKEKRKKKDLKRKEKKQKKQTKLSKLKESQEFAFKKDCVRYGDLVHQPPSLNFGKKKSQIKVE